MFYIHVYEYCSLLYKADFLPCFNCNDLSITLFNKIVIIQMPIKNDEDVF